MCSHVTKPQQQDLANKLRRRNKISTTHQAKVQMWSTLLPFQTECGSLVGKSLHLAVSQEQPNPTAATKKVLPMSCHPPICQQEKRENTRDKETQQACVYKP
jgi:hypothetical protein